MEYVDFSWKIGGEAGAGIMSTGLIFGKTFSRAGFDVFDYNEYPSLIRGGHNTYLVRVSNNPLFSQKASVDILVALHQETITRHMSELAKDALIVFDPQVVKVDPDQTRPDIKLVQVPFAQLVKEGQGEPVMINNVALGASIALLGFDFAELASVIKEVFGQKNETVAQLNTTVAQLGFEYINKTFSEPQTVQITTVNNPQKRMLISGNEAICLGAVKAGCRFVAAYPMTPINSIIAFFAAHELDWKVIYKEPEDEIAAINMAIGANFAGVRAMCATSGGGFSLMVEAVGLAAETETPLVVVEGQRPGPSTGLPTWTDQADLAFVINAAQGEFPRIIIAPGDAQEAFYGTIQAFNLAEKYQLPVVLLGDKYLMESRQTWPFFDQNSIKIGRGKLLSDEDAAKMINYQRYAFTKDGVSPRKIPGQGGGTFLASSDEHGEDGLYNEEADNRVAMMDKRFQKVASILEELPQPKVYGKPQADCTIVGWGSVKMPVLQALQWLTSEGASVNFINVVYVWPFPEQAMKNLLSNSHTTLLVENNMTAQFGGLIKQHTGYTLRNQLLKYDGRPFYPEEIYHRVKGVLAQ